MPKGRCLSASSTWELQRRSYSAAYRVTLGQGNASKRQRVFGVTLVRARPFYGFHAEDAIFVKVKTIVSRSTMHIVSESAAALASERLANAEQVMLLNPRDTGRAAALLQAGGILGRRFQPYESHIPYLLQFKVGTSSTVSCAMAYYVYLPLVCILLHLMPGGANAEFFELQDSTVGNQ